MCESVNAFTGSPLNHIIFLSILLYVTVLGAGNVIALMRVGVCCFWNDKAAGFSFHPIL